MRVKGEDAQGVYGGIDFLRSVIQGNPEQISAKKLLFAAAVILLWMLAELL